MTMTISILLKCSGCVLVTSLAHSGPEPAPADHWIQFSQLKIDITYLYCRLSLYEEILQSVDALLESVHGDLAAPAVGESLSMKSKLKGSLLVKMLTSVSSVMSWSNLSQQTQRVSALA